MPNVYASDHYMAVARKIASINKIHDFGECNKFYDGATFQIVPRTKAGYLIPVVSQFEIYNDDDFSSTYIIKARFEIEETKNSYVYVIQTNEKMEIELISSSCINLGLSMELLKKYKVSILNLIRNNDYESSSLEIRHIEESISMFKSDFKCVWIAPEEIYDQKGDTDVLEGDDLTEKIANSPNKKSLILSLTSIKFDKSRKKNNGYIFKLHEKKEINRLSMETNVTFKSNKHFIFNMGDLNYIKVEIVDHSYLNDDDKYRLLGIQNKMTEINLAVDKVKKFANKKKKHKKEVLLSKENNDGVFITKDKLNEMQNSNSEVILKFLGENI